MKKCKDCEYNLNRNGAFAKCSLTGEAHVENFDCPFEILIKNIFKEIKIDIEKAADNNILGC